MVSKGFVVLGFALFCLLQYSAAQTVHTVGDSTGWKIPPNAAFYANWAAGKTFSVGDSLLFNFTTDLDDVTRVPKRSYDLCSDDNEIGDSIEIGPATILLSTPGEYYFISSEDTHCQQGQKFAINVTAAAPRSPAPPSANPPTPTPTPGRAPVTHVVGGASGWGVQPGGSAFYVNWAAGKTFVAGDSLVFNFASNMDDVVRVTRRSFDLCSDDDDIGEDIDISPATMVLSTPGEYYFISSEDNRCQQGQKLAINVTAAPRAPMPPPSANPPPPSRGRAPVTHVVGDTAGWRIPPQGDTAFYVNWATGKTFVVGDSLVFNFASNMDDVVRVTRRSFDLCSDDDDIGEDIDISPATIVLTAPGEYYFISSENNNCQQGQKLAINVSTTVAPGPMAPPSNARPPPPRVRPMTHVVGDSVGWTVPQGGAAFYTNWAAGKTFAVGDSLVFNFQTDVHDVQRVTKRAFDICSDDDGGEIGDAIESGPATVILTAAGEHYYISSENRDCLLGQKLAINVIAARSNGPATSIATPPSSAMSPGGAPGSQPGSGPPNSSASTVAAALSASLFALVLNFF